MILSRSTHLCFLNLMITEVKINHKFYIIKYEKTTTGKKEQRPGTLLELH